MPRNEKYIRTRTGHSRVMAANFSVEAGEAIIANQDKIVQVAGAAASLDAQGWGFFDLTSEGGGVRNEMSISNGTKHGIELVTIYINGGKVRIPPEPYVQSMRGDKCLFHKAGSWAATGSGGIVTYKLQHGTNLHFMWDCPFNFDYYDNFIGLVLSSDKILPDKNLFNKMYWWEYMRKKPRAGSKYDLVCCGPSTGNSIDAGGSGPWGHRRPFKVQDEHYIVAATMGDRHVTSSKIDIRYVSRG